MKTTPPLFAACFAVLIASLINPVAFGQESPALKKLRVWVGSYSVRNSPGIVTCSLDLATGNLEQVSTTGGVQNPSFMALSPDGRFLYAVNETDPGKVTAFRIDSNTGGLTKINEVSSGDAGPCHIAIDATGKWAAIAHYGGGSVAMIGIGERGELLDPAQVTAHQGSSVHPRQKAPHAHSVTFSPDNKFLVAADLGLDKALVYRFNPTTGALAAHDPAEASVTPGSGPRHFKFHPSGEFAYLINELTSTLTAFKWDSTAGAFSEIETESTLPKDFQGGNSTAEVRVHPNGKFLYGSNRGHDSIAVFQVESDGSITPVDWTLTGGKTPRNFNIDPTGRYLLAANQNSDNITVFKIDPSSGKLSRTMSELKTPAPVCVVFGR